LLYSASRHDATHAALKWTPITPVWWFYSRVGWPQEKQRWQDRVACGPPLLVPCACSTVKSHI
jgi:hypothetical protein